MPSKRAAKKSQRPDADQQHVDTLYEVSERVWRQAVAPPRLQPRAPLVRPLRIYTLDPSVPHRFGGIATVQVPYERLTPGPVGALFALDCKGAPAPLDATEVLDLDTPDILLSSGLSPSPASTRFHAQMVYAVCSLTYAAFRRALGRRITWSITSDDEQKDPTPRLQVRPFAFEDENAYFDREGKCLAFGYFRAGPRPAGHTVPKGWIFTGLSHDVVAHETTHALLDALRSEFYFPSNADVLGFHEGFADLIALFLHFSYADVVEAALQESRGRLTHATLLSSLAQEFGLATSTPDAPSALRTAIDVAGLDEYDADKPAGKRNAPRTYRPNMEEHELGSVLVSAVFEAFTTIFRRKIERYLRIAGIAPSELGNRELPSELVRMLASEASEIAGQFMNICIRAIDYCPPVDMDLCEYLRALITADAELERTDKWGYREALMRSFRRRELFPDHVEFMTEDSIKWDPPQTPINVPGLAFRDLRFEGDPAWPSSVTELKRQAKALGRFVTSDKGAAACHLLAPGCELPKGVEYAAPPRVESVRTARRVAPDGRILFDLVAEVIQRGTVRVQGELMDFVGGCTIVIDPQGDIRYAIHKRLGSQDRHARQLAAVQGPLKDLWQKGRGETGKGTLRFSARAGVPRLLHQRRRKGRKGKD